MTKKFIAELIGTFALCFIVIAAFSAKETLPLSVPVIAGMTLGLFVYLVGSISGSHLNPAVTVGMLTIKKISLKEAGGYILAQILGAIMAIILGKFFFSMLLVPAVDTFNVPLFAAEALGTFFFTFGVASTVRGSVPTTMNGIVVGTSLLFGILVSSLAGAAGILNPAVAFALNSVTIVYMIAPLVGSVAGFQLASYLHK